MHTARAQRLLSVALVVLAAAPVSAQTIEDGLMMPKGALCTGFLYTYDSWDTYWEGTLERTNGNIGEITTQSVVWSGNYGVTDRLNVIAMVPYMWTSASQGVLQGQSGFQDLTVAAKLNVLETPFTSLGRLRTILVASAGTALSDYTPDFYPLSIGSASDRFSGRLTLYFQTPQGFYVDASSAYTFRGNVTLNRDSYFTGQAMYFSSEVEMPDVFDYTVSVGYLKGGLQVPVSFSQQWTRGGGDIRRQDMPFVSNRMNASRLSALVMYYLPKTRGLAVRAAVGYTVDGRNVGQATSITGGLMYTFTF